MTTVILLDVGWFEIGRVASMAAAPSIPVDLFRER
jgi:hypothetical protein